MMMMVDGVDVDDSKFQLLHGPVNYGLFPNKQLFPSDKLLGKTKAPINTKSMSASVRYHLEKSTLTLSKSKGGFLCC